MMKRGCAGLLLCVLLITGCSSAVVTPAPSGTALPATRRPPAATPTVDVHTPEQVGRGFLEAWEQGNYALMYELLTPALREAMTPEEFQSAYTTNLATTTTLSVTLVPQTLKIDQGQAWVDFRAIWHTALFGQLQASNTLSLIRQGSEWWVEWDTGAVWPDLHKGSRFGIEYQIPPRANIYDYQGAGLAVPTTLVTVGVVPNRIEDENLLLATLSRVLGMTPEAIRARYAGQPAHWYVPIKDISGEESLANDDALQIVGVERRDRTGRSYQLEGVGAHVIGWISSIPAESYQIYRQRGYRGDEHVGISGLEAWGESILAGKNGARLFLIGEDGSYLGSMADRQPERGRAIYSTLDRSLQHAAEQALRDRRGAVVALDIRTGAIRALTSGPTFDNNIFVSSTEAGLRQALLSNPNQPLLNRAILGQYPPGSVFKIITMAAALGPGGMNAYTPFHCVGYWDGLGIPNRKVCWLTTGHGDIGLKDGLSASCNVVFYEVGSRLDAIDATTLPAFARAFGLGEKTGLQHLPEAAGLVPDPAWKRDTYQQGWGTGDAVNMAIGQGFLTVTPLQIARMVAAVANGGTLYQPTLIDRISGNEQFPEQINRPQAVGHLPVSEAHLAIIQDAMLAVTTDREIGTATHRFSGLGIPVAGKTGTAEVSQEGALPHSWFAGYFPADNPTIAMVVLVEHAGEGSSVAAPMFRQILEGYYGMPITPLPEIATP
jgi:penicillin-binding protein 2